MTLSHENGFILFKKTRLLEAKIAAFLKNLETAGAAYLDAVTLYFQTGRDKAFLAQKENVSALEQQNDALRREVENQLYVQMILPDMRSDILHILEGSDKIINKYESNLIDLSIEQPIIPEMIQAGVLDMIRVDLTCVAGLTRAIRAFFDGRAVREVTADVFKDEHTVDLAAEALKEHVFSDLALELAQKLQLKDFLSDIEKISDIAEEVADRLMIMSVKHSV